MPEAVPVVPEALRAGAVAASWATCEELFSSIQDLIHPVARFGRIPGAAMMLSCAILPRGM